MPSCTQWRMFSWSICRHLCHAPSSSPFGPIMVVAECQIHKLRQTQGPPCRLKRRWERSTCRWQELLAGNINFEDRPEWQVVRRKASRMLVSQRLVFSSMCASWKHHPLQVMMSHGFTCCLVERLSTMPRSFQHVARWKDRA